MVITEPGTTDALAQRERDWLAFAIEPGTARYKAGTPSAEARPAAKTPESRATLLLAEEADDSRQVTRWILEQTEHIVVACENAQLASKTFWSRTDFDLLLSDIEMPGRLGVELARELTALRPSLAVGSITTYPSCWMPFTSCCAEVNISRRNVGDSELRVQKSREQTRSTIATPRTMFLTCLVQAVPPAKFSCTTSRTRCGYGSKTRDRH